MEKSNMFFVLTAVLTTMLANVYCEEQCGENQEWKQCGGCPKTCEDVANMGAPRPCLLMCKAGCECKNGFFLNSEGTCVLASECPCHEHAHYAECGSTCPLTCSNYDNPPKRCSKMCLHGCDCDDGYVRKGFGICVLPQGCHVAAEPY